MAHLSLVVVLSGLFIGYAEPFKTENQRLAEAQFRLFQTHRQVTLQIAGDYDQTILRDILCSVNGVKSTRISFDENEVQLAYSSELTSKQEIVSQLKSKGYDVSFAVK
ncbi:MAG TPA: hypothetical protein VGN64_08625 [Dyadobacter sp.]|nr:hypothetical protein [Dyadobacter sp.]